MKVGKWYRSVSNAKEKECAKYSVDWTAVMNLKIFLVKPRNPCPVGKVSRLWLCLLNDSLLHPDLSCLYNIRKGVTDESIPKTITNHMALPIPHTMDAEIQMTSDGRKNS